MITKCTEKEKTSLMDYLNQNRVVNLFIVGDIENFGLNTDFQHVFIDKDDTIHAVYLVYRDSLVICSYEKKLDLDFIKNLIAEYKISYISGVEPIIALLDNITYKTREDCYFAKMTKKNEMIDTSLVALAKYEQLPAIAESRKIIFDTDKNDLVSLQHSFNTKTGRSYAIFNNEKALSIASSTAECTGLAMVVGVGTLADYRGKKYASMCITKLSNALLDDAKTPCLFYNNPSAGRIYKALGYEDIDRWSMLKL